MIYKAIGMQSSGSPASITIGFISFSVQGKQWQYETIAMENIVYNEQWQQQLQLAKELTVADYMKLHQHLGSYIGQIINRFIDQNNLQHQVQLIVFNGHTIINLPAKKLLVQLGDGASIAASTGLAVVSDLSALDLALGGKAQHVFAKAEYLLTSSPDKKFESTMAQIPEAERETILTALTGVLRWREEATVLPYPDGSNKQSIGGAVWLGSEA